MTQMLILASLKMSTLKKLIYFFTAFPPTVQNHGPTRLELINKLKLRCSFKGYPRPSITWLKDGHKLDLQQERIKVITKR